MTFSANIFNLSEKKFYISDFAVVKKNIIPPQPFVCSHNLVLYERLFYVVKGTIVFNDEKHNDLHFSAGDIIYLPSNTIYKSFWDIKEDGAFISLNFLIHDLNREILNLSDDITFCCNDNSGVLYQKFLATYNSWNKSSQGHKLECMAHLLYIMQEIAVKSEHIKIGKEKRDILKAVIYLEEHYMQNTCIKELSKIANLQECQFRKKFKNLKGMSPIKYRNILRLNKSREILKSGEYSIVETSMIVGFDDPNYFSRLFRSEFGQSPSQYVVSQTKDSSFNY